MVLQRVFSVPCGDFSGKVYGLLTQMAILETRRFANLHAEGAPVNMTASAQV